jgi:hypothetical protein
MAIFGNLSTWSLAQKTKAKDAMTEGANRPLERTGKQRPPLSSVRVCRACLRARRRKSFLQAGEAEREGKRQGITARWGLKAAWSAWAERRTGSRLEVWHRRDERTQNRDALHPPSAVLDKSGAYAQTVGRGTVGDLRGVQARVPPGTGLIAEMTHASRFFWPEGIVSDEGVLQQSKSSSHKGTARSGGRKWFY